MAASEHEIERVYLARFGPYTRALAAVAGGEEAAKDAVQEGFGRALARRKSFSGGSLEAWIWKIVLREALGARRRRWQPLEGALEIAEVASKRDPELAAALRRLPPRRRLIVFLRYFADLSYAEIAALCGISPGTVGAALTQAHAELRTELESKGATR